MADRVYDYRLNLYRQSHIEALKATIAKLQTELADIEDQSWPERYKQKMEEPARYSHNED